MNICQKIKTDIIKNQLPRGKPLRQVTLSSRYGVSRIPIRDALLSLKAEGWLVPHGKAGVMIPALDWKEAEDLYLMRSYLEGLIFNMAFEHICPEDLLKARGFLMELDKEGVGLLERGKLNWSFHKALYQAANRPTLLQVIAGLNEQVVRYMGFQYGPLDYRHRSEYQHEILLNHIENKDKISAECLLKLHIEEAGVLLVDYLKSSEAR
ncbi:GntR family transcriptional regulator [Marinomonas transparens]|uniref:GntR family transcriptional regulator n=1 Tax=Marinomonas transparens TaxID=2795388 RepID=A0A934N6J6_9GAMM|nr:GntR family transcriptional regulator [Marinomonas transparens]MBJ7538121.1 GntR family transcriptional regulator [Marinomonas transparens]